MKRTPEGQCAFNFDASAETPAVTPASPPAQPKLREWALGTKDGWELCGRCSLCLEVKREGKWELR
jgi:hypothetical protein